MGQDDAVRPVVAPSYRVWLVAIADALEAGESTYSEQYLGLAGLAAFAQFPKKN
jgi:hypothetical protein